MSLKVREAEIETIVDHRQYKKIFDLESGTYKAISNF